MLNWLQANLASLIAGLLFLFAVGLIIAQLVKDKKAGRHICGGSCGSCGGGCSGCPMQGQCHKQ